jgi:hypothetical protein
MDDRAQENQASNGVGPAMRKPRAIPVRNRKRLGREADYRHSRQKTARQKAVISEAQVPEKYAFRKEREK